MQGQWVGTYVSNTNGNILSNIDDFGGYYGGYAVLRSTDSFLKPD